MNFPKILLMLPLITVLPVMAQQASVVRDTDLKAEPFADAKSVDQLKATQQVEVGERRGGWYKAKSSDGKSGWLRLTAILLNSKQGAGNSGVGSTAQFLSTGRSGSSGVTAATGIRGLDSADVVNSTPNIAAVEKLDALNVTSDDSRGFAAKEHLTAQSIDYLPAGG